MDTTGVAPLSKTLDSIGVFAKSMAETALVYDALVDDLLSRDICPRHKRRICA
jgi:Asp-tRNA(Asn)/Glu-tRNA(Gln) amidotransferase A subunit family amidase